MEFADMLEDLKPKINWKVVLIDRDKEIYRQMRQMYFEHMTIEACKMEVRNHFQLATPSTVGALTMALLEDSQRQFDFALFRRGRKDIVGFLNGVFDLNTGKLRRYQSSDFVCQPLPHVLPKDRDPEAETWFLDILKSWVGEDTGNWFMNILAYFLFIYPNGENIWLNLFGSGSNGKSVCLQLLEKILGDDKVIGCDLKNINRFSGDTFKDKWLVIGRDSSSYVSEGAVSFIKTYTGDPKLLVEKKGGSSFDVYNPGKLIVSTNNLIQSKDRSYAWYRRLFPIPFPNEFSLNDNFKNSLFKRIPEVIRCLLHRAYLYKHNETTLLKSITSTVRDLMKETRMLNDRVTAFWEEYFFRYVEAHDIDPQYVLDWDTLCFLHGKKMSDVYDLYVSWHIQEFGDMNVEPSLKTFGGQYGAFLGQTKAGKYFAYRKTKIGRVLELRPEFHPLLERKQ